MKNITDLREHLFLTLEALRDPKNPMDIERAKTISQVAQTVIESAKVECQFLREVGGSGTGFLPEMQPARPKLVGRS